MIVGNDCELAALTGKMLERSGYNAVCSSCGEEVTAQLENENIGLVIAELDNDENERICFCKTVKGAKKPPKLLLIICFSIFIFFFSSIIVHSCSVVCED